MKNFKIRNIILLLLTATIWGTGFIAQSIGVRTISPVTFSGIRLLLAGIALLPLAIIRRKNHLISRNYNKKDILTGGVFSGICLFVASTLQTIGIRYTTVGKAGFITTFYIVLVPVIGMLFGRKASLAIWAAVALALTGLYFICINEKFSVSIGDGYCLICAVCFAVHILIIDHFSEKTDGIRLSCIQFLTGGGIGLILMFFFGTPSTSELLQCWKSLFYSGVVSGGAGYTLQIVGQKGMNPSLASLLMSLESCVSLIAGVLVLGQEPTGRELFGCILMFSAVMLVNFIPEIPDRKGRGCRN